MSEQEENTKSKSNNEHSAISSSDSEIKSLSSETENIKNNVICEAETNKNLDSKSKDLESETKNSANNVASIEKINDVYFPTRAPKSFVKEKPKISLKKDDDVEEFDTDDEENDSKKDNSSEQSHSENISYEGDKCIYTEPGTGRRLLWNKEENKWCEEEQSENTPDTANLTKYEFDGKNYVYTNSSTNVTYKYIQETNEWVVKDEQEKEIEKDESEKLKLEGTYGFENDTHTYTDPSDGTAYFWDKEKNAWFPKVDDDFMARYQMSYGFTETNNTTSVPELKEPSKSIDTPKLSKEEKKAELKRKNQEPPTWFDIDDTHNTTIYISNLPLDITFEELKELVTKCGLLARDEKGKDKLKLYMDSDGELKGDARCTYIKIESVDMALNILDGWTIRDKTISVERAKFQLKGKYDPSLKPKRKKKDKERQKKIHQKLLDWRPDRLRGEPLKCERVVILKNLFEPKDFDKDVTLLLEYQQDVRDECRKCGEVKKVTIYDRHPEGVAQVTFTEPDEAQRCIQLLNNRWFGQRRVTAEIWDGKTKYKIRETEEEIEARINNWDKFLEDQDEAKEAEAKKEAKEAEAKKEAKEAEAKKESLEAEAKKEAEAHSASSSSAEMTV